MKWNEMNKYKTVEAILRRKLQKITKQKQIINIEFIKYLNVGRYKTNILYCIMYTTFKIYRE